MTVFMESLQSYVSNLSLHSVIVLIMMIFMIVGGIDKICGNRTGYGEKFTEGFMAMGSLASAMVGMIVLVPVIKMVFGQPLGIFFRAIGADPSLFAGILLGTDLGGYPLAKELAQTEALGNFTGLIVAAVMGINVVFNIPVGMGILKEKDRQFLAVGMLIGFATVPIACLAGGAVMIGMHYDLTMLDVVRNTIPIVVVAVLIILGLVFIQDTMLRGFIGFGKAVTAIVTFGTMVAVFQYLTGIRFPLFYVMVEPDATGSVPLINAITVVGEIAIVLLGAFPMVKFINDRFTGPIRKIGAKLDLDEASVGGLIANLANNIAMFQMLDGMNTKGKIMNCAFTVSAAFVLGDHLGFCAGQNPQMIVPMMAAKFAGGITALILADILWKHIFSRKFQ